MDWTRQLVEKVLETVARIPTTDWWINVIAAVIISALFYLANWTLRNFGPLILRAVFAVRDLEHARAAVSNDGGGLWLSRPVRARDVRRTMSRAANQQVVPIIVLANLKGGVGKTTTTANLGVYYALEKNERVLMIDFDYQGSLTAMALTQDDYKQALLDQGNGDYCLAAKFLEVTGGGWVQYAAQPVDGASRAKVISSFYSLANMETKIMIEWLIGVRRQDVRFDLKKLLDDDAVRSQYDRILIDAPPRLTTACIEALCAATHVLIPTILDEMSAEAVGTFATQLAIHKELWPNLRLLGSFGTMTAQFGVDADGKPDDSKLNATERSARVSVVDALAKALVNAPLNLRDAGILPVECNIAHRAQIANMAGHKIVFAVKGEADMLGQIKSAFRRLGGEIDRRITLGAQPPISSARS